MLAEAGFAGGPWCVHTGRLESGFSSAKRVNINSQLYKLNKYVRKFNNQRLFQQGFGEAEV
jgi:hypothetical protein